MTFKLLTDRRSWLVLLLFLGVALAGCQHAVDDDNGDVGATDEPTDDPTGDDPVADPAPPGEALSQEDIQALVEAFDDQPFQGGQGSPEHVNKWVTDDTFISLHFNNEDPAEADQLLWIVIGQKGVFCSEAQPGGSDGGFTHFHQWESDSWEGGHGGDAGDPGYWLVHLGVDEFSAPAWDVVPGVDYNFMPTDPPECGGDVPDVDFDPPGSGPLGDEDIERLNSLFDDEPLQGGQETPEHVWKWVNEDVFIFLHYNHEDPSEASELNWYGLGVRGEFCESAQPHADFTHFHQWESDSWEGGHGGPARAQGYWLLHAGVHEFSAPAWEVEIGPDRNFMPTDAPEC